VGYIDGLRGLPPTTLFFDPSFLFYIASRAPLMTREQKELSTAHIGRELP
jgi:hypothetical protein